MNTYECFEKDNNKSLCEIETRLTIIETLSKNKKSLLFKGGVLKAEAFMKL